VGEGVGVLVRGGLNHPAARTKPSRAIFLRIIYIGNSEKDSFDKLLKKNIYNRNQ
jgi:hypothetical protein